MNQYEIISFYTLDTPYEQEAEELKKTLIPHGISTSHICGRKSLKNWHKNCCMKPFFIEEKLKELNKPVVWIDSDARVLKNPVLFEQLSSSEYDISYHLHRDHELLSGTLFFRPTEKSFSLLEKWKNLLRGDIESSEQKQVWPGLEQSALQHLMNNKELDVKVHPLPKEYVCIPDLVWWKDTHDPVIIHTQASRRLKKIVTQK